MAGRRREPLEDVSQTAFGREHTLELMLRILDRGSEPVTQKYLINESKLSPNTVSKTLGELTKLGLLQRLDDIGTREIPFQRIDSRVGWEWAKQLGEGLWPRPENALSTSTSTNISAQVES
jgi:hypothetical protein